MLFRSKEGEGKKRGGNFWAVWSNCGAITMLQVYLKFTQSIKVNKMRLFLKSIKKKVVQTDICCLEKQLKSRKMHFWGRNFLHSVILLHKRDFPAQTSNTKAAQTTKNSWNCQPGHPDKSHRSHSASLWRDCPSMDFDLGQLVHSSLCYKAAQIFQQR